MSELDNFYLNKDEPNKSCFLALRDIIRNHDEDISESRKYGMPCFSYKGKGFCYLWFDKKTDEPYILWVEGKRFQHPSLEMGNRKRMKILRINPNEDLPVDVIQTVVAAAIDVASGNY